MDIDKDGFINRDELLQSKYLYYSAMHSLGHKTLTEKDIDKMISEVDLNQNHLIEFKEFLKVF